MCNACCLFTDHHSCSQICKMSQRWHATTSSKMPCSHATQMTWCVVSHCHSKNSKSMFALQGEVSAAQPLLHGDFGTAPTPRLRGTPLPADAPGHSTCHPHHQQCQLHCPAGVLRREPQGAVSYAWCWGPSRGDAKEHHLQP